MLRAKVRTMQQRYNPRLASPRSAGELGAAGAGAWAASPASASTASPGRAERPGRLAERVGAEQVIVEPVTAGASAWSAASPSASTAASPSRGARSGCAAEFPAEPVTDSSWLVASPWTSAPVSPSRPRARTPSPTASASTRLRSASPGATSRFGAAGPGRLRSPSPSSAAQARAEGLPDGYREVLQQIERSGWESVEWERGFTLLHWAAKHDRAELCRWLLQQGADEQAADASGQSAVDYALTGGCEEARAALTRGRAFAAAEFGQPAQHGSRQANLASC